MSEQKKDNRNIQTPPVELIPCPRCGKPAELLKFNFPPPDAYSVWCSDSACPYKDKLYDTPEESCAAWNSCAEFKRSSDIPADEDSTSGHSCSHVVPPSQFSLKLKPCPFCGSHPQLRECSNPEDKGYYICCICFPVQISVETLLQPTAKAAAAEWNTRAGEKRRFSVPSFSERPKSWMFIGSFFLMAVGLGIDFNMAVFPTLLGFGGVLLSTGLAVDSLPGISQSAAPVLRRDLPSCSLCGEVPSLYKTVSGRFRVQCSDPSCWGSARKRLVHLTEQEAAAAWTEAQKS